MNSKNHITKI